MIAGTKMMYRYIHEAKAHSDSKFYPSTDKFTQALLVMPVTNIMSVYLGGAELRNENHSFKLNLRKTHKL